MRRRAARIDENQPAIVKALEAAGALVLSLAAVGKGCADLLVYRAGRFYLLEVKNPLKLQGKKVYLTPDQVEWHAKWPVTVVETIDQALATISSPTA